METNIDRRSFRRKFRGTMAARRRFRDGGPMRMLNWFLRPPLTAPNVTVLLRLMAGSVFLWEGILKLVYASQGVGRFGKLGFPWPAETASFVAGLEIVGGLMLLAGLFTRMVAVPMMIEMIVAMLATKIALYLGTSPLPLPAAPPQIGAWAVLHEIRSEWAQLLTTAFLFSAGPGRWSLDAWRSRARAAGQSQLFVKQDHALMES
ncbi:MAG TPA: DoxX family protein [Polyangia bacterium]|nr:DoxX family protein [Polyangia bacterium]